MSKYTKASLQSVILDSKCSFPLSNHFATTVTKAKAALALELKLYQKVIYKNTNSHKKTKYWQRIRQVKNWIQSVQLALEYFSSLSKPVDTSLKSSTLLLYKLYALDVLCLETMERIKSAYGFMASLLEQTYFMAIALGLMGCVSRFRTILKIISYNRSLPVTDREKAPNAKNLSQKTVEVDPTLCPRETLIIGRLPQHLISPLKRASDASRRKIREQTKEVQDFLGSEDIGEAIPESELLERRESIFGKASDSTLMTEDEALEQIFGALESKEIKKSRNNINISTKSEPASPKPSKQKTGEIKSEPTRSPSTPDSILKATNVPTPKSSERKQNTPRPKKRPAFDTLPITPDAKRHKPDSALASPKSEKFSQKQTPEPAEKRTRERKPDSPQKQTQTQPPKQTQQTPNKGIGETLPAQLANKVKGQAQTQKRQRPVSQADALSLLLGTKRPKKK